jgi:hypothetical protein
VMRNFVRYELSVACGVSANCFRAVNVCISLSRVCSVVLPNYFLFFHHVAWCHTVSYTARKLCVKEMHNM